MEKRTPITTTAKPSLLKEAQNQGLKISDVLESALIEVTARITGEQFRAEVKKREIFQQNMQKALNFIENNGLMEKWLKENNAL